MMIYNIDQLKTKHLFIKSLHQASRGFYEINMIFEQNGQKLEIQTVFDYGQYSERFFRIVYPNLMNEIKQEVYKFAEKIEQEYIIPKELEHPIPVVHSILVEEEDLKMDQMFQVTFKLEEDRKEELDIFYLANIRYNSTGEWVCNAIKQFLPNHHMPVIFQRNIIFYDFVYDQLINFLKTKPAFRVRTATIGDERPFYSLLYPKIKDMINKKDA
jgi:hypothetical protein